MQNFEQYRDPSKVGHSSHYKNLMLSARFKHSQNHHFRESKNMANSSVSLPNWNCARLQAAVQLLKKNNIKICVSDLLVSVLNVYSCKMQIPDYFFQNVKCQNQDRYYRFVKTSVYTSTENWERLHLIALHSKVCLSHALDIALRLYLKAVVQRLLRPTRKLQRVVLKAGAEMNSFLKSLRDCTADDLQKYGKYQKIERKSGTTFLELRFLIRRDRKKKIKDFNSWRIDTILE